MTTRQKKKKQKEPTQSFIKEVKTIFGMLKPDDIVNFTISRGLQKKPGTKSYLPVEQVSNGRWSITLHINGGVN